MPIEDASTEFVDASDIRFAYRWLGPRQGTPLLLLQHFTGTMDSWDPAVISPLVENRPVIVFNNTDVGKSSGKTHDNVDQMTTDATTDAGRFIEALWIAKVDLLGFSLGGFIAQTWRQGSWTWRQKITLVATAPQGGEEHLLEVRAEARSHKDAPDLRLPPFFTLSEASRRQGAPFSSVQAFRSTDRDPESGKAVSDPQAKALIDWCATEDPEHSILKAIYQPALIASEI